MQAVALYYGVYDFINAENMHELMLPFLEHFVIKARYAEAPERYRAASPISYVQRVASPFFVLHGDKDELLPCGQARSFCAALRAAGAPTMATPSSRTPTMRSTSIPMVRSRLAANAVADFLGVIFGRRVSSLLDQVPVPVTTAS